MEIKSEISNLASNFLNKNFSIKTDNIEIQKTKKDFVGDITIVLFPYLKIIDQDKSDFGEEFIKLSRDVHFFNDERAKIKLEMNNHTGSKIKEIKEYTSY